MKKFLDSLTAFFNSLAQARTAASLARLGHTDAAVKVMQK